MMPPRAYHNTHQPRSQSPLSREESKREDPGSEAMQKETKCFVVIVVVVVVVV